MQRIVRYELVFLLGHGCSDARAVIFEFFFLTKWSWSRSSATATSLCLLSIECIYSITFFPVVLLEQLDHAVDVFGAEHGLHIHDSYTHLFFALLLLVRRGSSPTLPQQSFLFHFPG